MNYLKLITSSLLYFRRHDASRTTHKIINRPAIRAIRNCSILILSTIGHIMHLDNLTTEINWECVDFGVVYSFFLPETNLLHQNENHREKWNVNVSPHISNVNIRSTTCCGMRMYVSTICQLVLTLESHAILVAKYIWAIAMHRDPKCIQQFALLKIW